MRISPHCLSGKSRHSVGAAIGERACFPSYSLGWALVQDKPGRLSETREAVMRKASAAATQSSGVGSMSWSTGGIRFQVLDPTSSVICMVKKTVPLVCCCGSSGGVLGEFSRPQLSVARLQSSGSRLAETARPRTPSVSSLQARSRGGVVPSRWAREPEQQKRLLRISSLRAGASLCSGIGKRVSFRQRATGVLKGACA